MDLPPSTTGAMAAGDVPLGASPGFWREAWRRFRQRKLAMAALALVAVLTLVAIFAPMIAGTRPIVCKYKGRIYFPAMYYYNSKWENPVFSKDRFRRRFVPTLAEKDPDSWAIWPLVYQDPFRRVEAEWPEQPANPSGSEGKPSRHNWLGTNQQGFDVFASMVHGAQTAVSVGFVSMGIAATIGITLGALAGYVGRWVDILLSRIIEVVMCVPSLVLILALVALLDRVNNFHLMAIVGLTHWTGIARLTRAEFMKLKQMEFVAAAKAMGARPGRIMFTHVLRNALAPVLVPITFGIASAILVENALSFLGFGSPPPSASWGNLLKAGQQNMTMWWLILFPGLAIFFTVLAYNLIGEGLQEATDPRLREGAK